jgi:hypothetical protein
MGVPIWTNSNWGCARQQSYAVTQLAWGRQVEWFCKEGPELSQQLIHEITGYGAERR